MLPIMRKKSIEVCREKSIAIKLNGQEHNARQTTG